MPDLEYAWRHAFSYADCHIATDDAVKYANHYCDIIEMLDEPLEQHWPDHSDVFWSWNRIREQCAEQSK